MWTAGLAPSTSSATAQRSERRDDRAAELARAGPAATTRRRCRPGSDFLNDSGSVTECVAGSKTGGLRSASRKDAARSSGEPGDLGQHAAGGVGVDLLERAGAEDLVAAEDLEQVELEVPQVALVVAHARSLRPPQVSPHPGCVNTGTTRRGYPPVTTDDATGGSTWKRGSLDTQTGR